MTNMGQIGTADIITLGQFSQDKLLLEILVEQLLDLVHQFNTVLVHRAERITGLPVNGDQQLLDQQFQHILMHRAFLLQFPVNSLKHPQKFPLFFAHINTTGTIEDNLKLFYYRGLKEWNHEKGFLMDTFLTAQDLFKAYLDYFRISYRSPLVPVWISVERTTVTISLLYLLCDNFLKIFPYNFPYKGKF